METSALRHRRAALSAPRRVLAAAGDDRLAEQIRRGNDVAFEVVYDRHHRGILAFCRHMLGSREEAEDAVQQTFASAYSALRSDQRDVRLKAWLYTIARNRCLSILRARREQPAELDDRATAGLSEQVQERADLRDLLHDLRELPREQREALVLFELGDLSHAEIAGVIGVEPMKVKALVFQARSTLIETREARAIPCAEIREDLSTATGGALRRGPLRRHLKACDGCREYRDQVRSQRRALTLLLPVVPTTGLKEGVLGAIGFGGGGGAGGAGLASGGVASVAAGSAAGGGGAGGLFASLVGAGGAKLAVVAAVAGGTIAGGGVGIEHAVDGPGSQSAQAAESHGGDSGASGIASTIGAVATPEPSSASVRPVDDPVDDQRAGGGKRGRGERSDGHGDGHRVKHTGNRVNGADHQRGEGGKQGQRGGSRSSDAPRGGGGGVARARGKSRVRRQPHAQPASDAATKRPTRAGTGRPTRPNEAPDPRRGGTNGPAPGRSSAGTDAVRAGQDRPRLPVELPR
jgi:RNA polymerase sigma factor (sigma-70 family)